MSNSTKNKIEYLVVDTSAFIKNVALQDIGENILTVPEVIKEITSKRQLRRLVVLPYDLKVKETFPEHVKFVTEFSKKTGDYPSLSATDIQVIALVYQLEKEKMGIDHLRTEPVQKVVIESTSALQDFKDVPGFYLPDKDHNEDSNFDANEDEVLKEDDVEGKEDDNSDDDDESGEYLSADDQEDYIENEENDLNKYENVKSSDILRKVEDNEYNNTEVEENLEGAENEDDDDEDGGGWITPSNITHIKKKINADIEEEPEHTSVACLTLDFAMQNVLKQIGLNVVSLEGKLIKEVRTFILRCYGCFKTTGVMTKIFCPNCGNKTLKKVAISVNPDGTQKLHINFKRPLTARGKKFSLPMPQGGKHANNPILCEDQPMPQQRPSRLARAQNKPLDDDYIAGYSPFVMRDVNSKSAMLGIRPVVKNWMRSNPNEVRRQGKKNKKK